MTDVCRHGFHPGRCLAPTCEYFERPAPTRAVRDTSAAKHGVRQGVRSQHVRLTREEAQRVRGLITARGIGEAVRIFGLAEDLVWKAAAQELLHPLSAETIRARLARISKRT